MKNQRAQQGLLGRWYQLNNLRYLKLIKRIKKNEGFSSTPYKDQLGFVTIGYGHLILSNEKHFLKKKISKKDLDKIFTNDFNRALKNFNTFLKYQSSNKKQSELLIEMIFQMGIKNVLRFKKLLLHLKKGNKHLVCFEMMKSLWYNQTPNRVNKHIYALLGETGVKKR